MIIPSTKVLVIEPSYGVQKQLVNFLDDSKFSVETATIAEVGIQKALQERFDVILCQINLNPLSGFQVFKNLKNSLLKNNSAFFLIMEQFESDDVMIGLEMGIDNFLIPPFNKQSLLNKIDIHLKKQAEVNFVESARFKEIFNLTPLPLIVVNNGKIDEFNNAYKNLLNLENCNTNGSMFLDVFDIDEDSKNKMNVKKLENGLIESCILNNVRLRGDSKKRFTINKYSTNRISGGKVFAEVVLKKDEEKININVDTTCPQYGTCLKAVESKKIQNLTNYILTPRENEVYQLSAKGMPIKQIAGELKLSARTIEKHRSNIMQKVNCRSIIEAIQIIQRDRIMAI